MVGCVHDVVPWFTSRAGNASLNASCCTPAAPRCPGRFFAEMELALLVQLVLLQLQLVPDEAQLVFDSSSTHAAGTTKTKCGEGPGICNACMPQAVRNMLVYGLGALGGSQQQREQWRSSGDPQHKLPCCNLLRLVGFKVPEEPWLLQVSALT